MNLLTIKEALSAGERDGQAQALLFSEGRSMARWREIREHPYYQEMLLELAKEGELYLETPIRSLRFSDYKGFDTTGERKPYEREYFDHRGRLKTFALLAMTYEETRYIEALEDTIWAICDEYTWSLPSHMEGESLHILRKNDGFVRNPNANPYRAREHENTIDLMAAETGFALSEICAMLGDKLAPLVVHRAKKLVRQRIIESYADLDRLLWWETTSINWAAVCASSVGAAALYLIEDGETLAPIVRRLIDTMDIFLSGYAEDGACTEGLGYWNYGFGYFVYFAELLRQRTNGRIDLLQGDKQKQIASFQHKCYLTGNHVVSFSDGPLTANFQPGLTHYLKSRFESVELPDIRYRSRATDDHAHRWTHAVRNFVWSIPAWTGGEFADASEYLPDARWIVSRTNVGGKRVCFSAKGGHNGEPHNHNDVGSFLYHIDGETLLTDTGMGEYTKQYFGPDRYSFFSNGSHGHSVPIIGGICQAAGRTFGDQEPQATLSEERDAFSVDIAGAYPVAHLKRLLRNFEFDKKSGNLTLTDRYSFERTPTDVVERFVTLRPPTIEAAGKVRITGENACATVSFDAEQLICSIEEHTYHNHQAVPVRAYCIDLKVRHPQPDFTVTLTFEHG